MTEKHLAGYLFAYFKGEPYPDGEQVYFALSKENNPLEWEELNGGKPILTSHLGEKGVRDPFIIRSVDGERFYLIATDLKIHGNGDWERAVKQGSRSIMIWESSDLVNWSQQRMVEIAPPDAGCTWAPEVFYDKNIDEYIIFWASMLTKEETDYHQMLSVRTRDFVHFSNPEVLIDYDYSIIDTTVIEHNEEIFRFSKGKNVIQEKGSSFFDSSFTLLNENIEQEFMERGEGPIVFKSNIEEKWYLFIDEYGLRGYLPLETTDPNSGKWKMLSPLSFPFKPRHGSVLPITEKEYKQLKNQFGR
ncbi:hypothetical protein BTS2_2062 [Bacillus sp. TS-2]|nr:hypothetical protein BTS2_2062 [Bacillus sp. TS-2]